MTWESRAAARRGAEIAGALPEARQWLRHITADVSMDLGEVIDREGRAEPDLSHSETVEEIRG